MLEGGDDDDDQAAHTFDTYNSSQTVFQTPPPPPTQETQTGDDEGLYGRGYRGHYPPALRFEPSGPRPRKTQLRRRPRE